MERQTLPSAALLRGDGGGRRVPSGLSPCRRGHWVSEGSQTCERAEVRSGDEVRAGAAAPGSLGSSGKAPARPRVSASPRLRSARSVSSSLPGAWRRCQPSWADAQDTVQMVLACCVFRACCLCISLEIRRLIPIRYRSRSNLPAASGMLWGSGRQEGEGPRVPRPQLQAGRRAPGCAVSQPGDQRAWPAMGTVVGPGPDPAVAAQVRQAVTPRGLHPGSCQAGL